METRKLTARMRVGAPAVGIPAWANPRTWAFAQAAGRDDDVGVPMKVLSTPRPSLARTFAVLSLVIIALTTAGQVGLQWMLLREDLLDWERTATAREIRGHAATVLRAEDFHDWRRPESQARFAEFFRHALFNPQILRVKVYSPDMYVIWSDETRLLGRRFPGNLSLTRALAGEVVAHLDEARKPENIFERSFARTIEMYVPVTLPDAAAPGTASVAGIVEIYKDPSPVFGNLMRDRLAIVAASLAGALVLYAALFWIVRRASRQIDRQRLDLERHAEVLGATNRELRAAQQQLRVAERLAALGEASTAVAHGIRNPLANIRASAQLALDRAATREPVGAQLGAITTEVDRLGVWLRAVLDSVRPFEPHVAPVDVNAVVQDTIRVLRARLESGEICVERRLTPELPKVPADEAQLQQALLSVMENAIDALAKGGRLTIETAWFSDNGTAGLAIVVRDDGVGIPPERLARVLEPFYTTKTKGTGLGLVIARRIVEAHGGRLAISSEPRVGTAVRMVLPVEPPMPAP